MFEEDPSWCCVPLFKKRAMEAKYLWFKGPGLVVLEQCSINRAVCGRDEDYVYDRILIDYLNRRVFLYPTCSSSEVYMWHSTNLLPAADLIIYEFVAMQLSIKSSTDIYEMLALLAQNFGRIRPRMSEIAITYVQYHRMSILEGLENYLPSTCIQRAWKRCISDPSYHMCRRRLIREASEAVF